MLHEHEVKIPELCSVQTTNRGRQAELPSEVPAEIIALYDMAWQWNPTSGDPAADSSLNASP